MHVPFERDFDIGMSEKLGKGFGIESVFNASRGKGVPQRVKTVMLHMIFIEKLLEAVSVKPRLDISACSGQKKGVP